MIEKTRLFLVVTFKLPFHFTHHMFNNVAYTGVASKEGLLLRLNIPIRILLGFILIQSFLVSNFLGLFDFLANAI